MPSSTLKSPRIDQDDNVKIEMDQVQDSSLQGVMEENQPIQSKDLRKNFLIAPHSRAQTGLPEVIITREGKMLLPLLQKAKIVFNKQNVQSCYYCKKS